MKAVTIYIFINSKLIYENQLLQNCLWITFKCNWEMTTLGNLISHGIVSFMPNSHLLEKQDKKEKRKKKKEKGKLLWATKFLHFSHLLSNLITRTLKRVMVLPIQIHYSCSLKIHVVALEPLVLWSLQGLRL